MRKSLWIPSTIWITVLLILFVFPKAMMADDVDCNLLSCGFGTLVATKSDTLTVTILGISEVAGMTTDVYFNNGVYTYLYDFTQSSNVPLAMTGILVLGFTPTAWNRSLNWGVVTDLTTAGLDDCGDTGGLGCEPSGFGIGIGGGPSCFIKTSLGFQWPGVACFGTGVSPPGANNTNTFAFYGQSYAAPVAGESGQSFIAFGGGGPSVLVPSSVPEPSTLLLFGSGLLVLGFLARRER